MMAAARPILKGDAQISLRRDALKKDRRSAPVRMLVAEDDAPLFSALKAKRRALAEASGVPAYVVFNDRTLIDMVERRPGTLDEMAEVTGVGAAKLARYGAAFLEVILGTRATELHPARRKLAGETHGPLYDRLAEAQAALRRGPTGTDKPMSCPAAMLAKLSTRRPSTLDAIERIIGEKYTQRFGEAFLHVLAEPP